MSCKTSHLQDGQKLETHFSRFHFSQVQNEEEHPGFCSIKWLGEKKLKPKTDATLAAKTSKDEKPKKRARKEKVFLQLLLDDDDYLSSLKVCFSCSSSF